MEIKILGTGCPKCKRLEQVAREAAAKAGVDASFTKVTSIQEIMTYPIVGTPGLVIDGEVKSSGRIPQLEEVVAWIQGAAA
jgi:small redox-active disulfide protein 2